MPRRQKKRSCKTCQQAEGETKGLKSAQAGATQKKSSSSPSSPHSGITTRLRSAFKLQSAPQVPQTAFSTTKSRCASSIKTYGEDNSKIKKKKHSSQVSPSTRKVCKSSLNKTAHVLVNFIMHIYKMKRPIMKVDMLKMISKKYRKHFLKILRRASFNIEVVFGMELKKLDSAKHSYILVSKMNLPKNGAIGQGLPKTGLLMNILGVIFLKGNCATEQQIWEFLNKMEIYDGKKHFIFGETRKLITQDLVKLKYLEYREVPNSNPTCYEFLWGPRSYAETSKMKILEFWAKINRTTPSAFHSCYDEALREEEERARTSVTSKRHSL